VRKFSARIGVRIESVAKTTMEQLSRYAWPGNIRELENVLERAVILSNGPTLEIDQTVFASATAALQPIFDGPRPHGSEDSGEAARMTSSPPLESLESSTRSHILAALEKSSWVIDGPHGAAKILAVHPNTLRSRIKKLGIVRTANESQQS
jgi:formate hydrogenlyase transcriptional activator